MKKAALVVGATGNVGEACLPLFTRRGWEVTAVARRPPPYESPLFFRYDILKDGPPLPFDTQFDLVVLAQGVQYANTFKDAFFWQHYLKIVDSNLNTAARYTELLVKGERLKRGGLVVYCSSIQATHPRVGRGPYAVAKGGVESLAKIAAVELAPDVRAVALRLGQLTTPMKGIEFEQRQLDTLQARSPLPWVGAEAVARLTLNLYHQPSLSGVTLEVSSAHTLNIW